MTTEDRLRARWAKRGGGPDLEARLEAMKDELHRREKLAMAKAKGVHVSDNLTRPVTDPSGAVRDHRVAPAPADSNPSGDAAREERKRRGRSGPPALTNDATSEPQQRPISVEAVMEEVRAQAAREAMVAAASGDGPPAQDADEDDEEVKALEAGCLQVYETSRVTLPPQQLNPNDPVVRLKDEGNKALRAGDYDLAHALYTEALEPSSTSIGTPRLTSEITAVLRSNRARVRMLLDEPDYPGAAADARVACEVSPDWPKAWYRLAEAQLEMGLYALAMKAARQGERAAVKVNDRSRAFDGLMDAIAMRAAREGSLAGFDGRLIYVRSAGEEAWLGREAPENPAFDDFERGLHRNEDDSDACGRKDAPIHARSLVHAMELAKDGDRILVLRGIHNGLGESCHVERRVLVRGEGLLRDATVDARANVPMFRISRPCVIQNLECDFTGFCEAIRVEGDERVNPLIEGCSIKCSGDDGVLTAGKCRPTFRNCEVQGKRAGLQTVELSAPEMVDCVMASSGMQGVKSFDESTPTLRNCHLENNSHEGVVAMQRSCVTMTDCVVRDNKGPGVDVSDTARVALVRCKVSDNVGGVWLWDESSADVTETVVSGGKSHAVLCDADATPRFGGNSRVEGVVEASEAARVMVAPGLDNTVELAHPDVPTSLPAEDGCFKYEYDMFTRKQ